jgi:hypothetical protein
MDGLCKTYLPYYLNSKPYPKQADYYLGLPQEFGGKGRKKHSERKRSAKGKQRKWAEKEVQKDGEWGIKGKRSDGEASRSYIFWDNTRKIGEERSDIKTDKSTKKTAEKTGLPKRTKTKGKRGLERKYDKVLAKLADGQ